MSNNSNPLQKEFRTEKFGITVFTDPLIPRVKRQPGYRNFIKFYLKKVTGFFETKPVPTTKYGGHYGVTRSLCEGLAQLQDENVVFNYNPAKKKDIYPNVIVLDGVETLQQCIRLKNKGRIKVLFAGPNIMVRSNEFDNILANESIDRVIVPGEWVKIAYIEDQPGLKDKIIIWPAGVNEKLFSPVENKISQKKIMVYQKNGPEQLVNTIATIVEEAGYSPMIIRYGSYNTDTYKTLLNETDAAVFLSKSESEGIAMLEAWSMDVPTFVWQSDEELTINNKLFSSYSSAPYLTQSTGSFFTTADDFRRCLQLYKDGGYDFAPRKWVMENLTDKIASANLIAFFKNPDQNGPYAN